jgi:hydrogenase maturation protease
VDTHHPPAAGTVLTLVGGVGELYQGDLDLGRRAAERLAAVDLGPGVLVEDLCYGAVAVCQRLEEVRPDTLVLVGSQAGGHPPGTVTRTLARPDPLPPEEVRGAVADAVSGYVSIGLLLDVAAGLGALPRRTVVVAVEPATTEPSTALSSAAEAALDEAVALACAEARRAPVLTVVDQIREALADGHVEPSAALDALHDLLAELDGLDAHARWGRTFAERDRLRLRIADGLTGEGMTHLDWGLWWTLIEALDRLQSAEAEPTVQ